MWITIIADASYCPDTGKAGYGFWIASQRGKMGGDGVLKGEVENNIAAEMMALLNALDAALKSNLVHKNDSVLMQTDCEPAIDAFKNLRQSTSSQEKRLVKWFKDFCKEHNLHVRLKHVKGHTDNEDARYVVNNICDRKARRNMRRARDEHKDKMIREYLDEPRTEL